MNNKIYIYFACFHDTEVYPTIMDAIEQRQTELRKLRGGEDGSESENDILQTIKNIADKIEALP